MPLTPGSRLGAYEIEALLGAGGMGEVYRARDTRLDRTVAIKVLAPALASDPQFRERFEREARTLSHIEHPHICALYDVGTHDGAAYLVMQFLEGETLAERLARGPLPAAQALQIAIDVCDALDTAHRHGVIHRDLKPGNIMLTKTGARLLDFGLAREGLVSSPTSATTIAPDPLRTPITGQGTLLGTLHYMAPEQLKGQAADARSDIFALGLVLYEMLSGRRPFQAPDTATLIAAILAHPVPPLAGLEGVTAALERAVDAAVQKAPDDRWQTCRDFGRALTWIAGERVSGIGAVTAPARRLTRRQTLTGAAAGIVLATAGAYGVWGGAPAAPPGPPVIVLMDSAHPQRVYDPATLKVGGTNADDLTDQLRDLPVSLLKETTGSNWHREDQILAQQPALVLVHRSTFYDATMLEELPLNEKYFAQLYPPAADKLEMLVGYLALGNPRTRFVVYSRGSWDSEPGKEDWVTSMERRFPRLRGRLVAFRVPRDRATFRHPETAAEMRRIVTRLLGDLQ